MLAAIITIVAVLCLLICFMIIPMRVEVVYAASAVKRKQLIRIRIFHITVYNSRANQEEQLKREKKRKKNVDEKQEKFSYAAFKATLNRVKKVYELSKDEYLHVLSYLSDKTSFQNFTIHLDIGFEDAAHTGLAAGAAYGIVYGIAGLLYRHLSLNRERMDIQVNPRFQQLCADLYVKSIFCASMVHIIRVILMLYHINRKIAQVKLEGKNNQEKAV